jgi:shikimate dehydrogenase
MKKYLVIGNPIEHTLSPKLHNFWIKQYNLDAYYEKKKLKKNQIQSTILDLKNENISGINVTLPFKQVVIPFLDELSPEAKKSYSVNTIYKKNNKVIGHNTDIAGFELGFKKINFNIKSKKVFILGAGGVVPSIILALQKMEVSQIFLSNRTKKKAENLKKFYQNLQIVEWGKICDFDVVINATSLGLKENEEIDIDFSSIENNKLFYDIIYNPIQTKFLSNAKKLGNKTENGKMMFIYQAHQAFTVWHQIMPTIDDKTIKLLDE